MADRVDAVVRREPQRACAATMLIVVSLDLYANVTPLMMARADWIFPHIDMAESGRVARHLARLLGSARFAGAFQQAPS